ncbi:hypothetical protein [Candidatus Allofournierella excrementavium]|uniref:hypothetical protein n=1 Tax=Candidatus Allofournierella excrementavium TaxID=2838591 RepID=UPI003AF17B0F
MNFKAAFAIGGRGRFFAPQKDFIFVHIFFISRGYAINMKIRRRAAIPNTQKGGVL